MVYEITSSPELLDRFWSKVAVGDPDECWPWTASMNGPYGQFAVTHGQIISAHRVVWLICFGPLPRGHEKEVHHHCKNTTCCNPLHLRLLTRPEHGAEHYSAMCQRHGDADLRRYPSGHRYCAICNRERVRAWKAQRRTKCLDESAA